MYSYEIVSLLQRKNNCITVRELNGIMSKSPQANYLVLNDDDENNVLIKIRFNDIDTSIEARVIC